MILKNAYFEKNWPQKQTFISYKKKMIYVPDFYGTWQLNGLN